MPATGPLAQAVAQKMAGGPPSAAGPAPNAADPQMVERGKQLFKELIVLIGQGGPQLLAALKGDIQAFVQTIQGLAGGGRPPAPGQPGVGGGPPPGGPPPMPRPGM